MPAESSEFVKSFTMILCITISTWAHHINKNTNRCKPICLLNRHDLYAIKSMTYCSYISLIRLPFLSLCSPRFKLLPLFSLPFYHYTNILSKPRNSIRIISERKKYSRNDLKKCPLIDNAFRRDDHPVAFTVVTELCMSDEGTVN